MNVRRIVLVVCRHPYYYTSMQIFVKCPSGKTLTFEVESSDTIHSLKARVQIEEGIPVGRQNLTLFNARSGRSENRTLSDHDTLSDLGIRKENYVFIRSNPTEWWDVKPESLERMSDVTLRILARERLITEQQYEAFMGGLWKEGKENSSLDYAGGRTGYGTRKGNSAVNVEYGAQERSTAFHSPYGAQEQNSAPQSALRSDTLEESEELSEEVAGASNVVEVRNK